MYRRVERGSVRGAEEDDEENVHKSRREKGRKREEGKLTHIHTKKNNK